MCNVLMSSVVTNTAGQNLLSQAKVYADSHHSGVLTLVSRAEVSAGAVSDI